MSDVQLALNELVREFDRLGIGRQIGFDRLHLYSIITHSTAIEGSTLTLEENTVMFDEGIVPAGRQVMEQMMNHDLKRAYEVAIEVAKAKTPLSVPLFKALSALVMSNTGALHQTPHGTYDESKGDFRLLNVSAGRGGRSYLAWEKVEARTTQLIDWLNAELQGLEGRTASEVYALSFEAHYRIVTIHPWSDGNGRMGRLLMNMVQMEGNVVPSYVRSENKAAYLLSLRQSQDEGTSAPFHEFMGRETQAILTDMLDEYSRDMAKDVPWSRGSAEVAPQVTPQVTPQVEKLLHMLLEAELGARELREGMGLTDPKSFRERYLRPCLDAGYIVMTIPDKPNSRNQRYQITARGRRLLAKE